MAPEWTEITLGELIDIRHGFAFKGQFVHDEPNGHVLLTPGNFAIGGGFKGDKLKYYNGVVPEEFILHKGDVIVTMTDLSKQSDTLGYPAFVPACNEGRRYLHNQRIGKITLKDIAPTDARYIYYVMCSTECRNEVLASATGTTVKHTSPDRIKRFRFSLPPLQEQRTIAHILGTLDDKIELNRRMNETLDTMARALFKSWFVDFEPVRAKVEGTEARLPPAVSQLFPDGYDNSALGKVPLGWKVVGLSELIDVNPRRPSLRKGESAPYVPMSSMPRSGHTPSEVSGRSFGSGTRFINGDTLVARITPCLENGKTAYVDFLKEGQVGWGSTEYIVLRPKPILPSEFAYCLARSLGFRDFAIQSMTGTSGRQRVQPAALGQFLLPQPPEQIGREFGRLIRPLIGRARVSANESRTLAELRDAILPRLVSGEIRVQQAERVLGKML